jgi:hypothetical protein
MSTLIEETLLNATQIKSMLVLQKRLNNSVNPNSIDLVEANRNHLLAGLIKTSIEFQKCKLLKKETANPEHLQRELICVWHFIVLALVKENPDHLDVISNSVERIIANYTTNVVCYNENFYYLDDMILLQKLQLLRLMYCNDLYHIPLFMHICKEVGLSQESLYKEYMNMANSSVNIGINNFIDFYTYS